MNVINEYVPRLNNVRVLKKGSCTFLLKSWQQNHRLIFLAVHKVT